MVRYSIRQAVLAVFAAVCLVSPATAQSISGVVVPKVTMSDRNGVDLSNGTIITDGGTVTIGLADAPALSQKILATYYDSSEVPRYGYLRQEACPVGPGNCYGFKPEVSVRIGARALVVGFSGDCRGDCDVRLDLVSNNWVLTDNAGKQWIFDNNPVVDGGVAPQPRTLGWLREIRSKNGERLTYNYQGTTVRSITSNLGYQINYQDLGQAVASFQLTNLAYEYCDKFASTCPNQVANWPKAQLSGTYNNYQMTDALSRVSSFSTVETSSTEQLVTLTTPMGLARKIWRVSLTANGPKVLVRRFEDPTGSTDYVFTVGYNQFNAPGNMKVLSSSATRSSGGVVRFSMDDAALAAASNNTWTTNKPYKSILTDENQHKTIYQFSQVRTSESALWLANSKIYKVTTPEQSETTVSYLDERERPTSVVQSQKPGYGTEVISTSAKFFDTTEFPECVSWLKCTDPNYTLDARNNRTDYTYYEDSGLLKTATGPAGANNVRPQTRYRYEQRQAVFKDASGQAVPSTTSVWKLVETSTCRTKASCAGEADELKTTYEYDANLLPVKETKSSGDGVLVSIVTKTYDPVGNLASVDGPLPGTDDTTYYFYDAARQLVGTIIAASPSNRATRTFYNDDGQPTLIQRGTASGTTRAALDTMTPVEEQTFGYDAAGRKVRQDSRPYGGATYAMTQYRYNNDNRLQCVAVRMNPDAFGAQPDACLPGTPGTDGPDRITFTEYDLAGQVKKVTSGYGVAPQVDKEVVEYTDNGLERIVADGKGNRTTYEYDGFDQLMKVRYPTAGNGTVSSTTDYDGYCYDAAGNRTTWRRRDAGAALDCSVVTFTYDALNRVQNGLRGETYGYDNLGHRTSANFAGGTASATFDALGRLTSETTNGRTINYEYDPAGNRTKMAWPDGFAAFYERNALGAITFVKEKQTPTSDLVTLATYNYDDLGRFKSLVRPNGLTTRFGYDAASRLTCLSHTVACTETGRTWTFTYNAASQVRTREANDTRYEWPGAHTSKTYEANGLNQYAKVGTVDYRYGGRGNLICDAFNTTTGACEGTNYGYDIVNNLTTVTVGGATKTLGYEPTGRLELVSGTTTTRLLYAGSDVVAEYDGNGALLRRYVPGPGTDAPIVWYEGSGTADRRWLLADPQGSIVAVTNGSGTSIITNTYDEYGVPGPFNQGLFQYTGQIWLPEVGLYHYKARAYSPTLGRFMQADPTGYDDGLNWYAYADNDPLNRTDPTGGQSYPACPECMERLRARDLRLVAERKQAERNSRDPLQIAKNKLQDFRRRDNANMRAGAVQGVKQGIIGRIVAPVTAKMSPGPAKTAAGMATKMGVTATGNAASGASAIARNVAPQVPAPTGTPVAIKGMAVTAVAGQIADRLVGGVLGAIGSNDVAGDAEVMTGVYSEYFGIYNPYED